MFTQKLHNGVFLKQKINTPTGLLEDIEKMTNMEESIRMAHIEAWQGLCEDYQEDVANCGRFAEKFFQTSYWKLFAYYIILICWKIKHWYILTPGKWGEGYYKCNISELDNRIKLFI